MTLAAPANTTEPPALDAKVAITQPEAQKAVPPPASARSPQEIEELVQAIQGSLIGRKQKPSEPKEEAQKEEELVKKPVIKRQPTKPSEQQQRIERSTERFTEAAARLTEATERANATSKLPEPAKQPEVALSKKDQRMLETIEEMGRLFPDEYAQHAALYKAGFEKERGYIANWQKENPGEKFNPDADDHADFYEESFPTYDEADLSQAAAHLGATKAMKTESSKREDAQRREESTKRVTESAANLTQDASTAFLKQIDDNAESIEKLRESDPMAAYVAERVQSEMKNVVNEVVKLFSPGSTMKASQENPLHQQVFGAIQSYERDLAGLTREQLTWKRGGEKLQFATWDEFSSMTPKEKAKSWTLWTEPEQVAHLLANDYAAMAKADIEIARGGKKQSSAIHANGTPASVSKTAVSSSRGLHQSSSVPEGGGSVRVTTLPAGGKVADDLSVLMANSMFGG